MIGVGGGGEVHEAIDHELGRQVAVKSLHAGGDEDEAVRARFLREIHLAQKVTHRNVCRIFDLVRDGDRSFVTMELLEGETLAEHLASRAPLSVEECVPIVRQIVAALDASHAEGIVHRDLKPENVLLVEDSGGPRVVVTDFGLATLSRSEAPAEGDSRLTLTGHAVGTPSYMAPEQLESGPIGPAADVYALGLLIFEMVTGTRPVTGATAWAVARDRLEKPAPSARERRPDLDSRWDRVIGRCLERDPDDRFQTPGEVYDALTDTSTSIPASRSVRRRRGWAAGVGVALVATILAWWLLGRFEPPGAERGDRAASTAPVESPATSAGLNPRTVAVLPFATVGTSSETELLATGLHNDLLNELSRIGGLSVISRTSVLAASSGESSLPELARTLGAGTLLEGTLQGDRSRLRLTLRLVDGSSDTQRWTDRYDGDLEQTSLFDLQNDVVGKVIATLQAELGSDLEFPAFRQQTTDLDAYRSYTMGLAQFERRTEEGLRKGREHFQAAVARDPHYALAWAGLAHSLWMQVAYGFEEPSAIAEAGEAARRAVAVDPTLAEANAALSAYHAFIGDGASAGPLLDRAIQLRPSYADAYSWRAYSRQLGNEEGDLDDARRAVELNPVSIEALGNLAMSYLIHDQPEQALVESDRMADLAPGFPTTRFSRALALRDLGRLGEARDELTGLTVPWTGLGAEATLSLIHLELGDRAAARGVFDSLDIEVDPFAVGLARLAFGETDEAFAAFDRVGRLSQWPSLAIHHLYPETWDPVRDDPRFHELVDRAYRTWGREAPDGS